MEFSFSINDFLSEEIMRVEKAVKSLSRTQHSYSHLGNKSHLGDVINEMGIASAKAQGLNGAITGVSKLAHTDHHLYVMKDAKGSNGKGSVVGILKMGNKKLFIYDSHGNQHEKDPLCVLDFYVHESKQRLGCGKKLFEYMLKEEGVKPMHLAVDRPSSKFLSFLIRHYNLKAPIPQVNNFVVFEGFFNSRAVESKGGKQRGIVDQWQHPLEPSPGCSGESLSSHNFSREAAGGSGHDTVWQRRHGSSTLLDWDASTNTKPGKGLVQNNADDVKSPTDEAESKNINNSGSVSDQQNSIHSHPQEAVPTPYDDGDPSGRTTPPMLQRDGPSEEYIAMKNSSDPYNKYTDRRGHLLLAETHSPVKDTTGRSEARKKQDEMKQETSWNLFGVNSGVKHSAASRGASHTRLW